jgi:hypothetical protein
MNQRKKGYHPTPYREYNEEFSKKGSSLQSSECSRQRENRKPGRKEVWGQLSQNIEVWGMWRTSSQEEIPMFEFNKQNCCS